LCSFIRPSPRSLLFPYTTLFRSLPINNGTVFMTHSDREFLSFPKLLKEQGYYTMGMHGNNGDFWNRNTMYRTLGYDKFYSQGDYIIDEEIGLGLRDRKSTRLNSSHVSI